MGRQPAWRRSMRSSPAGSLPTTISPTRPEPIFAAGWVTAARPASHTGRHWSSLARHPSVDSSSAAWPSSKNNSAGHCRSGTPPFDYGARASIPVQKPISTSVAGSCKPLAGDAMRYLCLIYLNEQELAAMPESQMNALNSRHLQFNDDLLGGGQFI